MFLTLVLASSHPKGLVYKIDTAERRIVLNIHSQKKKDNHVLVLNPAKFAKITVATGVNRNTAAKVLTESDNFSSALGYDFRAKFYLSDRWRLLFENQTMNRGKYAASLRAGLIFKF